MTTQLKNPHTFRVFFSSPFKGLEEEREELTRKYIPEIQHKCAEMGLQFVTVDMRWGISVESAQQAQTINICFKEIDRSDMFVNFFGQRYGWQGHTDNLLQENINTALGKYPWLENFRDRSVTELEVRHGFLNNPGDMPTVFCFRDKKYDDVMKDLFKEKAANYTAENEDAFEKLSEFKKNVVALQSKALAVHEDYSNPFEGARLIYEAIMKYLNENFLKQSEALPRREKDIAPHNAFALSRTSLYVRNQEHYDFLNAALKSGMLTSADSSENGEGGDRKCAHVVVVGPAGCGKSSLLCNWLHSHVSQLPNTIAIPFYVSCAPSARDPEGLLDFVYGELEHHLGEASKPKAAAENQTEDSGDSHSAGNKPSGEQENNTPNTDGAQTDTKHTDPNSGSTESNLAGPGTSETDVKGADSSGNNPDSSAASADAPDSSTGDQSAAPNNHPTSDQQSLKPSSTESDKKDSESGAASDSAEKSANNGKSGEKEAQSGGVGNSAEKSADKGTDKSAGKEGKTGGDKDGDSDKEKSKAKEESRPKGRELQYQVVKKLEQLVGRGNTVVLVFDAANRLVQANKTSKTLYWLPQKLCKGVVCVVSTDETDLASISILQDERSFQVLKMGPLQEAAKTEICVQTLKYSGKELSPAQLQRVVEARQTENPLFLKIVLAELSIFGYFRKLDQKIDSLIQPSSIKELLQNCLERLEADYNDITYEGNLVGEIMRALFVAHHGLTESEICNIFKIPSNIWSPMYFAMEYFIVSNMGNLGFAFTEIQEAVKERYFQDADAKSAARRRLITYFDGVRKQLSPWVKHKKLTEKPVEHALVELVWLLRMEGDKEAVATVLTDLPVFRIMNDAYDLELLELWQWTGLKWSEICNRLLTALDVAIADCYVATEEGILDTENSPGVRMRVSVSHMRSFFDLANCPSGSEKILEREIRILENAEGKMDEPRRKELLRDTYYYLACTYATQDRYQEARALHETNMAEFEKALEEKEDEEIRKQIAYTHNGLGIVCMHSMEYMKSIEHITKSTDFHHKNKDRKNEAAGYTNLALDYMYMKLFDKALEYNHKALEAYEEGTFGQLSMDVGNVYTNMGLVYRRMKNLNKAEEAYLKSLEIKAKAVGWDHMVIATAFMNLGTLEMHRSNYAKAEQWTRKAIGVYQANELAVTKKEYRRCRENLFANLLKQGKFEEVLPLYIEIFDILHQNDWLDECLAGMHRQMVGYMLENRPDMLVKAEEISMALINSSKAHPQNYGHLVAIDQERGVFKAGGSSLRPYKYSLDACMEKFPTHSMYDTIVELKMEMVLLPKEDREGIKKLMKKVAVNFTDNNLESIVLKVSTVAQEQGKTELWFQVLRSALAEEPSNLKLGQLFLRLCVHLQCVGEALPFVDAFLAHFKDGDAQLRVDSIKPSRTRLDVAKVLVATGSIAQARQLLLLATAKTLDSKHREEANEMLDSLPEIEEENFKADVTSAA